MAITEHDIGPKDPATATPSRRPGWIRRTTTIDTVRPDEIHGRSVVDARARDGITLTDGSWSTIDAASYLAGIDGLGGMITTMEMSPPDGRFDLMVGSSARAGFRRLLATVIDDPFGADSLLHLLLDDLPGAALVAGYAVQNHEATVGSGLMTELTSANPEYLLDQADQCAGWVSDGVMLSEFRAVQRLPNVVGPAAPDLDTDDDPDSWHEMGDLPPHGMRRRRRLDLGPVRADGTAQFDVHFRDNHLNPWQGDRVVHEYEVTGTIDATRRVVTDISVIARVLPWVECPGAVGSAQRVVDVPMADLRTMVRTDLTGTSTCTHLNDVLRGLADLPTLLDRRDRHAADLPSNG
ncbi:MAG: DUF2889 domain-containing protein [Acidimicrobiales bacterium]